MENTCLNPFIFPLHNSVELLHQSVKRFYRPIQPFKFLMTLSNVALGGKQQMASVSSHAHDLLMAALTNCSLKFFLASNIA